MVSVWKGVASTAIILRTPDPFFAIFGVVEDGGEVLSKSNIE